MAAVKKEARKFKTAKPIEAESIEIKEMREGKSAKVRPIQGHSRVCWDPLYTTLQHQKEPPKEASSSRE